MVWIGKALCEKFRQDIMARTFALIAPVWRVLHHVSCSSETVPNAPKQKETHQNMSLGPNCVDRDRPFQEILTRLCGTNFALIAPCWPILHRVLCSRKRSQMHPNGKKRTKT